MLNRASQQLARRHFAVAVQAQAPLIVRNNRIAASVILSRAPQITRDSTPFETAYFDYKEKLQRQAADAFPSDFYFKKGSVAERRWKEELAARTAAMRDMGTSLSDASETIRAKLETNDSAAATTKIHKASRETAADAARDVRSLDRALQRTLYLVVHKPNDPKHPWQFPEGDIQGSEYLHEAAERQLQTHCGRDMDIWFVGRQPISVYKQPKEADSLARKVFFMKARVYAGQVKPSEDVSDFAWLTKEELGQYLSSDYYNSVKECLGDS